MKKRKVVVHTLDSNSTLKAELWWLRGDPSVVLEHELKSAEAKLAAAWKGRKLTRSHDLRQARLRVRWLRLQLTKTRRAEAARAKAAA